jgi:hypothetical protein
MIRPAILGLLTVFALTTSAVASASPEQPVPAQIAPGPTTPRTAAAADTSGYAQREQKDKQVANYEGGSFIVIGLSGGALVVLLLVLLLI